MKDFWDKVLATRRKGICDVDIDELPESEESACEVTID
jgi:hypothetical protein